MDTTDIMTNMQSISKAGGLLYLVGGAIGLYIVHRIAKAMWRESDGVSLGGLVFYGGLYLMAALSILVGLVRVVFVWP